jgi:hypothetical protein
MCVGYALNARMSIPKWRHVKNSDDGCNIYQCLSCYNTYDGRDTPKEWKYCPYCGVEWNGEHEWLIYGDNWDIISPARLRKDRRVSKAKSRWHIELQEMSLFKCDDGAYVPLHDGGVKGRWSSIYHTDRLIRDVYDRDEAKKWEKLSHSLNVKYGITYGCYIYYLRLMEHYLESIGSNKDFLDFSCGCDYRLHFSLEKNYREVIQERFVDMGGWRILDNKTHAIRKRNTSYKADDLESTWQAHGHK